MGLLTILRKLRLKEKEMRILVLGLDNAGKTTIVKRINNEPIDTISPTLGFNIQTLLFNDYKLNIFDIGGQKNLRSYWRNYFEQTDGIIWVVDSADIDRLNACKEELNQLLIEDKLAGASLLIFANKQDLAGAMALKDIRETLELDAIQNRHCGVVACSAVSGDGLADGLDWLVADIARRLFALVD